MRLSFLTFTPTEGFSSSWPMDKMTQVMGKLAKTNPKGTLDDLPGVVAFLWPKGAPKAAVRVTQGSDGPTEEVTVKPNDVLWLQKDSTLNAQRASGDWEGRRVNAQGEVLPLNTARRRSRAP